MHGAASLLQARARAFLATLRTRGEREVVIGLQARWRGALLRKRLASLRQVPSLRI